MAVGAALAYLEGSGCILVQSDAGGCRARPVRLDADTLCLISQRLRRSNEAEEVGAPVELCLANGSEALGAPWSSRPSRGRFGLRWASMSRDWVDRGHDDGCGSGGGP